MSLHTIIPGTLWGAAGWLPGGAREVSWLPPRLPGFLPVTAYALRDGTEWLAVDTGLPIHWPALRDALAPTLAGAARRRMVNTRRERDCMANLHAMARAFGIAEIPYVGVLNPVELLDAVEDAETEARIRAMAPVSPPVRTTRIEVGEVLRIGRLRLEPLRVQLRLLATNWFHEGVTGTLFTSDAFGWLTRPDAVSPLVRAPDEAPLDPAPLARTLARKFDWLVGIDPAPILADLDAIFAARVIERLCPGYGLVIEGESAVREALAAMRQAIATLAARRPPAWHFDDATAEETA